MSTGHYLLDHPNPHGPHHYPTRRDPIRAIVGHITAGLEDLDGVNDHSAERTAAYAASTERQVSWHSGSDADTHLYLLPATYTAFQCQGYNSDTYGHEISKRTVDWASMPAEWVEDTLREAADCLRPVVLEFDIPLRKATKAELDHSIATGGPPVGFLAHSDLDPERRRDPGANFPWARLFALIANPEDDVTPAECEAVVRRVLKELLNAGTGKGQENWAGTSKATLAGVQALAIEENTTQAALAKLQTAVDDLNTGGGSGFTLAQIATAVADEIAERGQA